MVCVVFFLNVIFEVTLLYGDDIVVHSIATYLISNKSLHYNNCSIDIGYKLNMVLHY